jgi:hypothetical protein
MDEKRGSIFDQAFLMFGKKLLISGILLLCVQQQLSWWLSKSKPSKEREDTVLRE